MRWRHRWPDPPLDEPPDRPGSVLIVFLLLTGTGLLLLALTGCRTAEVVAELPEGYWLDTWALVEALALDIWDILAFLLPVG